MTTHFPWWIRALVAICILLVASPSPVQVSAETIEWPTRSLTLRSPVPDLSFLNHKPAGIHGRLKSKGDQLVFEDGTQTRFWGTNLQANALFKTEPAFIRAHARRIAALGYNLVRIHHHDSDWVQPNVFGEKSPTTRSLDPESMYRLDNWISALKSEGIYVWLDLHVGRRFRARDNITAFSEIKNVDGTADIRGFNYVSPSIQNLMLEFQSEYLRHVNAFTNLSYAEDPAIIAVLITNENDLTHHFGNRLLPNKNVPTHSEEFMSLAASFSETHGTDPDATWRSWEYGPSKIFLNDLERRFNERMISGIRATGFGSLIATTNLWGRMSVAGLPSLTSGSIIDVHSYGTAGEVGFDPREQPGFLDWIAIAQVAGMPISVSEWNVSKFPVEDRFIAPLRMATSASHQGWDAPMIYGYAQQPLNGPLRPGNWSIAEDPALISMMPAAALLFRRNHVRLAANTFAMCLDEETFFGTRVTPETSIGIRTIFEQSRIVVCMPETHALPWLDVTKIKTNQYNTLDPSLSFLDSDAEIINADTGEFYRDFANGRFVVDTPKTQLVAGKFSGAVVETSNIQAQVSNELAAVVVQSLDEAPLTSSRQIMVSLSGQAVPSELHSTSFKVEPVKGVLRVVAPPELSLRAFKRSREALDDAHRVEGSVHVIDLEMIGESHWLFLE